MQSKAINQKRFGQQSILVIKISSNMRLLTNVRLSSPMSSKNPGDFFSDLFSLLLLFDKFFRSCGKRLEGQKVQQVFPQSCSALWVKIAQFIIPETSIISSRPSTIESRSFFLLQCQSLGFELFIFCKPMPLP